MKKKKATKGKRQKKEDIVKVAITKLIMGVIQGAKLSDKECIALVKYINTRDQLIDRLKAAAKLL